MEDVEEKCSVYLPTLSELFWQVEFELAIILVVLIEVFNAQLRVMRHRNVLHISDLEQLLAFGEDVFEEVFGDVADWRNVVLD